jgi:hypothetical protein
LREVRHTIFRLIGDHLRLDAGDPYSWQGHDFDFTDVDFDGGDFHGANFSAGTTRFTSAVFSGGTVDYQSATFAGSTVDYRGTLFSGGLVDLRAVLGVVPKGIVPAPGEACPEGLLLPTSVARPA